MGFFDFFIEEIVIDFGMVNMFIIYNDKVVVDVFFIVVCDCIIGKIIVVGREVVWM